MHSSPPTILVIDDQPNNLKVIVHDLNAMGFETLIALDGEDGLDKARRQRPELILLDVMMPGWDGFQTCRRLKATAETKDIPVLFLSARSDIGDKLRGFEAGGLDYITKPFDPREVLARISSHLRTAHLCQRMTALVAANGDHSGDPISDQTGASPASRPAQAPFAGQLSPIDERGLRLVYQARDILLAELRNPPDLATLTRRVGTNHSKLTREFQRHLGMSVFAYLREQRLAQAQSLLAETRLPIHLVADQVGFKRPGDFGTAFKRRFGVTPREFRRRTLAEPS